MADVINSVFFKDLNPSIADTHDTAFYDQAARGVRGVAFAFEPHYSLNFNAPVVSSKVRYIKALIDNAIASELNDKFNLLDDGETNLILFHRKKMFEQTQARLLRAKEIINSGGYILNDIMSAKDYTADRQRFECIFIFNYIVQASIREYLEFQAHYQDHIPQEKLVPLDRFYLEILGAPVPLPAFIVPVENVIVENEKDVNHTRTSGEGAKDAPESFTCVNLATNGECVKDLYNSLVNIAKLIDPATKYLDFKKVFTGSRVTTPIKWIGTPTELYYFIKYIYADKQYLKDVNKQQWNITCHCFVDKDGIPFIPAKIKSLKTPAKSRKEIIETAGNLLCE